LPPVVGPKPNQNQHYNSNLSGSTNNSIYNNNQNGYGYGANSNNNNNNPNNRNRNLNVDKDESGFYKARQADHNAHDRTVPDNHDMYVDMPVDYKKSKQVIHVRGVITLLFLFFY
jgi:hypothetical protein